MNQTHWNLWSAILLAPWANFSAVAAAAAERNCSSSDRKKPTQLKKLALLVRIDLQFLFLDVF
jgi:hypothetical protein